jgi:hypothetical protein
MATSIGITTGVAYCGNVGSSLRKEYAAVGDTVNLSARLMSKAHGRILIDEATYSRLPKCLRKTRFSRLPPMKVKGKDHPISPYEYKLTCATITTVTATDTSISTAAAAATEDPDSCHRGTNTTIMTKRSCRKSDSNHSSSRSNTSNYDSDVSTTASHCSDYIGAHPALTMDGKSGQVESCITIIND